MIGISAAARYPDRFHAYVGTEQLIDMPANEALSYRIILDKVRSQGDSKRVKALERIGPPPYAKPGDWGTKQFAAEAADPVYGRISKQMREMELSSPNLTLGDNINLVRGGSSSALTGSTIDGTPSRPAHSARGSKLRFSSSVAPRTSSFRRSLRRPGLNRSRRRKR